MDGRLGGSDSIESTCNAGDAGSIPGSGRSPGEGNGNPLQYSCLENATDRGVWVHRGFKESDMTNTFTFFFSYICVTELPCRRAEIDTTL